MTIFQKNGWLASAPFLLCFVLLLALGAGCGRSISAPAALPAAQLAPALEKAFLNAKPATQDLANQAVASLKDTNYTQAYAELHNLASQPGLTREQNTTLASVLFTVNQLLQSAQQQGDPQEAQKAAQALQDYRATK